MSRKETPDILGALMGGAIKQESNIAVEPESKKAIKQEDNPAIKKVLNKAVKPPGNKTVAHQMLMDGTLEDSPIDLEEPKEKATFNLPIKLLNELEDKWMEIRKMSGSKQVSKTLIVEEALRMAFAEFDRKKGLGKFYGDIVSNKAIKT